MTRRLQFTSSAPGSLPVHDEVKEKVYTDGHQWNDTTAPRESWHRINFSPTPAAHPEQVFVKPATAAEIPEIEPLPIEPHRTTRLLDSAISKVFQANGAEQFKGSSA